MNNETDNKSDAIEEPKPEAAPRISIDDFHKVEIRIGIILSAEKVENADKLLRLAVSFGKKEDGAEEVRQILSGIAAYFPDPSTLVSRHVAFAYNLAPRTIRGLESDGMIMAADGADGGIVLLEAPAAPAGSRVH